MESDMIAKTLFFVLVVAFNAWLYYKIFTAAFKGFKKATAKYQAQNQETRQTS
jgi:hypothetical protein